MQAGCTPFSVNLLSGSACFHGDLTSEIFHLRCQMPVDEAKPLRVTKYRHSPKGCGAMASRGFRVGAWTPLPRECQAGPVRHVLPENRTLPGRVAQVYSCLQFLWNCGGKTLGMLGLSEGQI